MAASSKHCPQTSQNGLAKTHTDTAGALGGKRPKPMKIKKFLQAPFQNKWPPISKEVQNSVLKLLKETFKAEGLHRKFCKRAGKKNLTDIPENSSSTSQENSAKWNYFIFGVNAVTRAVEKNSVSLVLVDAGSHPNYLTSHIVELCTQYDTPGAAITGLEELKTLAGLQSIACMAVKTLSGVDCDGITRMAQSIISLIPKLNKNIVEVPPVTHLEPSSDDSGDIPEYEPARVSQKYKLPPEDIEFSSLYVFKRDLTFNTAEEFISLGDVYQEKKTTPTKNKMRYMKTAVGAMKNDPSRPKGKKLKKAKRKLAS